MSSPATTRVEHGVRVSWQSENVLVWEPGEDVPSRAEEREIVVPGVATFLVSDGRRVVIAPAAHADPGEVQASLDGQVTAAVLQQRRTLPLHVSSVVVEGRALAFAGPPGSGKSSIACALADRGHALLTDELAAVTEDADGVPAVHPGRPVMRLWGCAARRLGWPAGDRQRIRPGVDKYAYALPERFADHTAPLSAIYVLVDHPGSEVVIDRVLGFAKFETLFSGATYNRDYVDNDQSRAWHFAEIVRVGERIPVYSVRSSAQGISLEELADELEWHATSRTLET